MKLDAVKFGIAFGIIYAAVFFLYGMVAALFGWGGEFIEMIGKFYIGFGASFLGALAGAAWGLVIGFVFFWLAGLIYNRLLA